MTSRPKAADEAFEAFVVKLVADSLQEERRLAGRLAERRHASLCESLKRDLGATMLNGGDHEDFIMGELVKVGEQMPEPRCELPEVPHGNPPLDEVEVVVDTAIAAAVSTAAANGQLEGVTTKLANVKLSQPHSSAPDCNGNGAPTALVRVSSASRRSCDRCPSVSDGEMPKTQNSFVGRVTQRTRLSTVFGLTKSTKNRHWFERIVLGSNFELFFGVLILANAAIMALEVQYHGMHNQVKIGFMNASPNMPVGGWPNAELSFTVLDWFFGIFFASEVFLKFIVMRGSFFLSLWSYFDTLIVGIWLVAAFATFGFVMDPLVLRAFRFARLLRLVKLMKLTSWFDTLVLMVSSIQASVFVLLWGVILLLLAMTMFALMLNSILTSFMLDEDNPEDIRHEIFMYLGTYSRCMVTMFEITLGNWVPLCRLLGDHVNEGLTLFFLLYRCVVGFAVMNVIKGVFLHETFRCAGLDDDLMVLHRRRMRKKFKDKMLQFFADADTGNDGEVTVEEFCAMVEDDRVNTWLEAMDLRVRDVGAERIFAFLAGGDGILERNELCTGMSRLRGAAQGLDVISLLGLTAPDINQMLPVPADVARLRKDLPRHSTPRA